MKIHKIIDFITIAIMLSSCAFDYDNATDISTRNESEPETSIATTNIENVTTDTVDTTSSLEQITLLNKSNATLKMPDNNSLKVIFDAFLSDPENESSALEFFEKVHIIVVDDKLTENDIEILKLCKELTLSLCGKINIDNLSELESLERFTLILGVVDDSIANTNIEFPYLDSLRFINDMRSLKFLGIVGGNNLNFSFDEICGLEHLDEIDLYNLRVLDSDLRYLKFDSLNKITISWSYVENLNILKLLDNLKDLTLSFTRYDVSQVDSICELNIEALNLYGCDVSELSNVPNIKSLKTLAIRNEGLTKAQMIKSYEFVLELRKIEHLSLDGWQPTDEERELFLRNNPNCEIININ